MANLLFSNNASSTLALTISDTDTSLQVPVGEGGPFPSPTGGDYFLGTLEDDAGEIEVVKCTSKSGDVFTVERGQDGTSAKAFVQGVTRFELRLTKAVMESLLQKAGGTVSGDIAFAGNKITDAVVEGGEIVNAPLRGAEGATVNQIVVPTNGTSRATASGAEILTQDDSVLDLLNADPIINFDPVSYVGLGLTNASELRIYNGNANDYVKFAYPVGTSEFEISGVSTDTISINNANVIMRDTSYLDMTDNAIRRAQFVDYSVISQSITATATTEINYTNGSVVFLDMDTAISDLNIVGLSITGDSAIQSLRLIITQTTAVKTVNWSSLSIKWAGGIEPVLSTALNSIDVVDLWTADNGTNWFGSYSLAWA